MYSWIKFPFFPSFHPVAMYGSILEDWHSARYVPLYMKVFCLNLALCTWLYWISSHWKPICILVFPCSFSFLRLVSFSNLMITRSVPSFQLLSKILKLLMTDPRMTTLQYPWRVTVDPWLTIVKRVSLVSHAPTFSYCIGRIFVYCSYKNFKWNNTKSLTKIVMNHTNPLQPQGWLSCQRKEVAWWWDVLFTSLCWLFLFLIILQIFFFSQSKLSWLVCHFLGSSFFSLLKVSLLFCLLHSSSSDSLNISFVKTSSLSSFQFLYWLLRWKSVIQWLQLTLFQKAEAKKVCKISASLHQLVCFLFFFF